MLSICAVIGCGLAIWMILVLGRIAALLEMQLSACRGLNNQLLEWRAELKEDAREVQPRILEQVHAIAAHFVPRLKTRADVEAAHRHAMEMRYTDHLSDYALELAERDNLYWNKVEKP